ncbi:uncharacterized, partial [Tachysurus ichikawai]
PSSLLSHTGISRLCAGVTGARTRNPGDVTRHRPDLAAETFLSTSLCSTAPENIQAGGRREIEFIPHVKDVTLV